MSTHNVVELTNVSLKSDRGDQIFDNLNLTLESGQSVIITGEAGAGKTILVELLTGQRMPHAGSVEMFGKVISTGKKSLLRTVRRRIGGVGGIFELIPSYTVAENVAFPLVLNGESRKGRREKLLRTLTDFSLLKQASQYPSRLTRVENTMVQFARASIASQPLLIVDEPAAGLDPKSMDWIYDYLVKVSLSGRSMIILSSEFPVKEIPNTECLEISNGALV